jgi:hypothetical protein
MALKMPSWHSEGTNQIAYFLVMLETFDTSRNMQEDATCVPLERLDWIEI